MPQAHRRGTLVAANLASKVPFGGAHTSLRTEDPRVGAGADGVFPRLTTTMSKI